MADAAHALPDDDRPAPPSAPAEARPDWLVSSNQGAEDERRAQDEGVRPHGLKLTSSDEIAGALSVVRPKIPVRGEPAEEAKVEKPTGPVAWSAAASSVPKLKLESAPPAAGASGASGRVTAPKLEPIRGGSAQVAPARRPAAPPYPPHPDQDEEAQDEFAAFPDDASPARPVAAAPRPKLDEPIWVIALDALRSNALFQVITLAVVIVSVLAGIFWPRAKPGVSLSALKREVSRWDGQLVRVNGRVGEVFNVGGGWAFYLHQGRDTIVVFTRGAAPRTRARISISGSVSTGFLDGQPRQAIFAEL